MRFPRLFSLMAALGAAAVAAHAAALPTAPREERFSAGNALTIEVPLDSAGVIRGGYPIDSAGFADLPIVGRIQVDGRTQEEVETFLSERLANYLKDTHLKVSPAWRITLLGHFAKQGQYYVPPNTTVWETVRLAGGIAGERTLDDITVWRGAGEIPIAFLDMYSQGRTLANAGFKSGDIVVVPVPRDNTGAWYWFKETLGVTAQLAGILSSVLVTYLVIENQKR
jgi:protein involved in polysaccharide export with SLBB domain